MRFDKKIIHCRIQTTHSHASCCHHCYCCYYCKLDFVLFHNVVCFTSSMLSSIYLNIANLLHIKCTLVAMCVILGRLECMQFGGFFLVDLTPELCFKTPD